MEELKELLRLAIGDINNRSHCQICKNYNNKNECKKCRPFILNRFKWRYEEMSQKVFDEK